MFPRVGNASGKGSGMAPATTPEPLELVDDAASSICIDGQDYVELDKAIQVLQREEETEDDFAQYNRMVARRMVLDQHTDDATIELDSFREEDRVSGTGIQAHPPDIKYDNFKIMMLGGCASVTLLYQLLDILSRDGPVGSLLGCMFGLFLHSLACNGLLEMMTFHPFEGGIGDYVSLYVNESLGWGVNFMYWLVTVLSAPQELVFSLLMLTQFPSINTPDVNFVVWMIYFFVLTLMFQLTKSPFRVVISSLVSLVSFVLMFLFGLFLLLLGTGKLGPEYHYVGSTFWHKNCHMETPCGPFRPAYGNVGGKIGHFLQLLDGASRAYRAAASVDKVFALTPRVRNPRKTIRKVIWYEVLRKFVLYLLPVIGLIVTANANDKLLIFGRSVPTFYRVEKSPGSFEHVKIKSCTVELSRWKHIEGYRTFLPVAVPFMRQNICSMNQYIAAGCIFMGFCSCHFYLAAATQTLEGLSMSRPFGGWFKQRRRLFIAINTFICICICVIACFSLDSLFQFMVILQGNYVFCLLGILNIAYIRFLQTVKNQTDSFVDRDEGDWPYRAFMGRTVAYFSMGIAFLAAIGLYFFFGGSYNNWGATLFFANLLPVIVVIVATFGHWYWYKTEIVDLDTVNLAAAKRALDEQEWVEDRIFRNGYWGKLYQWSRITMYWATMPLRVIDQRFRNVVHSSHRETNHAKEE